MPQYNDARGVASAATGRGSVEQHSSPETGRDNKNMLRNAVCFLPMPLTRRGGTLHCVPRRARSRGLMRTSVQCVTLCMQPLEEEVINRNKFRNYHLEDEAHRNVDRAVPEVNLAAESDHRHRTLVHCRGRQTEVR